MKKMILFLAVLLCGFVGLKPALAAGPLGYPWSSWGEAAYRWQGDEEGLKLDGYVEQGVDWAKLPKTDWVLNTFVGARFTFSDQAQDYWNNKVGPWFGVKVKRPLALFKNDWGEVALGVRGEYYEYTSVSRGGNLGGMVFLQWSFGGNWKEKK